MKKTKHNSELRLVSFAALLGITFMLVFSGVQLAEVPSMVGQALKITTAKTTVSTTCSETDGGDVDSVKGITKLKQNVLVKETKTDSCIDEDNIPIDESDILKEYYCESNAIKEADHACVCEDGVCTAYYAQSADTRPKITSAAQDITITKTYKKESQIAQAAKETSIIATLGCIDSDKGKTYGEQGTANDGSTSGTDVCRTDGKLREYYCDENDDVQEEVISCASGEVCSSGACITKGTCTDSESTFNMYAAGRVVGVWSTTGVSGEWTDSCANSKEVNEYYCREDGYAFSSLEECPSGYACSGGKCIDACSDTDETGTNKGHDLYTKGTTTGYWYSSLAQGSWTDYCTSDGKLIEYECTTGYAYSSGTTCPSGTTCSNGACV